VLPGSTSPYLIVYRHTTESCLACKRLSNKINPGAHSYLLQLDIIP